MIIFKCGKCNHSIKIDDKFAGKMGSCKNCGEMIQIPRKKKIDVGIDEIIDEVLLTDHSEPQPSQQKPKRPTGKSIAPQKMKPRYTTVHNEYSQVWDETRITKWVASIGGGFLICLVLFFIFKPAPKSAEYQIALEKINKSTFAVEEFIEKKEFDEGEEALDELQQYLQKMTFMPGELVLLKLKLESIESLHGEARDIHEQHLAMLKKVKANENRKATEEKIRLEAIRIEREKEKARKLAEDDIALLKADPKSHFSKYIVRLKDSINHEQTLLRKKTNKNHSVMKAVEDYSVIKTNDLVKPYISSVVYSIVDVSSTMTHYRIIFHLRETQWVPVKIEYFVAGIVREWHIDRDRHGTFRRAIQKAAVPK